MSKNNYILGDYIGFIESLKDEFKEFMFKTDPELFLNPEQIEFAVRKGELPINFNEVILGNLLHYFQVYLPKYISAFSNCEELEEGHLYFGVNNSGEITGIPFIGEITEKDLKIMLNGIKDSIYLENREDKNDIEELFDQIKIELHLLKVDFDLIPDESEKDIMEKLEKYRVYCEEYKIYREAHSKWLDELMCFNNKISYMILDPKIRNEIAAYIRQNAVYRSNIAQLLESDTPIEILNGIQLNDYKSDDDNIYYWVMFYKDYIIDIIRARKPLKPEYIFGDFHHLYSDYIKCLTKLRNKFIKKNEDLNYYLIKIKIPGKKKYTIFYKHPVYDWKWMMKTRSIGIQGPCCI